MMNLPQLFNQFQMLLQNPAPILSQMGLPGNALQNPQQAVQNLMNSGRMTQEQFNSLRQTSQQLQNMPQFQRFFAKR